MPARGPWRKPGRSRRVEPRIFHLPEHPARSADRSLAGGRAAKHPERVTEPAGLIDVAPTILDALRLPAPPSFDGISFSRPWTRAPSYSESVYARDTFRWAALRSLREGRWKYIEAPHAELFDLEKDPKEQSNLFGPTKPKPPRCAPNFPD